MKKEVRLQKNRDSARNSRQKKQNYCEQLEEEIKLIMNEISALKKHKWGSYDSHCLSDLTEEEKIVFALERRLPESLNFASDSYYL
jgi:hypothetical protein